MNQECEKPATRRQRNESGQQENQDEDCPLQHSEAEKIVIQAEQFWTAVEQLPPGRQSFIDDNDDKYFHLTCQVDAALKSKIESGEFVELDRLLPK